MIIPSFLWAIEMSCIMRGGVTAPALQFLLHFVRFYNH